MAAAMVTFYAPMERVQGIAQRIYYFHVPMAWTSYIAFTVVLVASIVYLWRRDPRWDAVARASVEVGVVFLSLVLVTGAVWGKPIWNTWWSWDARLTSTLVLWFIYVSYLMLRAYTPDPERAARLGAIVGIVGFVDIPVIHFSVQWWRTLHPGPVVARTDPQAPAEMLLTLGITGLAVTLVFVALLIYRIRLEWIRDENRALDAAVLEERVVA
jgi:heme exporter protein C